MLLPLLRNASQLATPSFLEIGAFNGEDGSQTWLVEKCLGWNGLLIEANPLTFGKLQNASRSRYTVRKHAAVCGGNRTTVQMREGGGTTSALLGINKGYVRRSVHNSPIREVPCAPLPSLMVNTIVFINTQALRGHTVPIRMTRCIFCHTLSHGQVV